MGTDGMRQSIWLKFACLIIHAPAEHRNIDAPTAALKNIATKKASTNPVRSPNGEQACVTILCCLFH
jgi:hypothetical protein